MLLAFRNLFGLCVAAVLLASGPSFAQESSSESFLLGSGETPLKLVLSRHKAEILSLHIDARDVLVTNPGIADVVMKTPRMAYILGQEIGETNVFFFDASGRQIKRIEVSVERDMTTLRATLARLFPNENIDVSAINQDIVISGTASSPATAEDIRRIARRFVTDDANIVNLLRLGNEAQVLLRVRIAEVSRAVVKQLGINTSIAYANSDVALSFATNGALAAGEAFGSGSISILGTAFDQLSLTIDALEGQGLVKTLAEPSLTAVSGETANLLVGGEFPVPMNLSVTDAGRLTVDIEFRQFGIVLKFTPVVLSSGAISLKLSTEVSQLDFGDTALDIGSIAGEAALVIPGLLVNRAETTVELPSGGSLVIAGLLQDDITNAVEGLPGLKDIPILGTLFRSTQFQRNETELVIAVTPYIVRPVNERDITLPTDGFAPANDFDLYFLGRMSAVYGKPAPQPGQQALGQLLGPIGYIME